MLKEFFRELLPNWRKAEAIGKQRAAGTGNLNALQSLRRRIEMEQAKDAKQRSDKPDPDRNKTSEKPVRDVHESPAPNPNGDKAPPDRADGDAADRGAQ